ncbi:hypothetical protein BH11PSE11_BH11PSE11_01830 [soil metagenome]
MKHSISGKPHSAFITRVLAPILLSCAFQSAQAVEDTGTPGDGKWEINLGASGIRTANRWEAAVPEAEFNYGWGERAQVQFAIPWAIVHTYGQKNKEGLGATTVGVKWRFVEHEKSGFSMSTFPQYTWNLLPSSVRRGIVEPGRQVLIPLQIGFERNDFWVLAEAAHNFVETGPDERSLGIKLARKCLTKLTCHVAAERKFVPHEPAQTKASIGLNWALSDSLSLKTAIGRDIGPRTDDQRNLILSFALQFLR